MLPLIVAYSLSLLLYVASAIKLGHCVGIIFHVYCMSFFFYKLRLHFNLAAVCSVPLIVD